ncbi:hypothetical protein [Actinokineospora sp. UTMC 2448]|uniref:hypothetical protein n=1 Tax=Actinokineospora sp. UTMC 2448 TaxID=2268449 RepID=UPI0021646D17|nr:hypothetical protein [Actinokineospora sp. UTMC 2448]UVS76335.1 hypothetical protein Actkin_00018 [Actinokineospora sp. UTMC 2448]
MSLKLTSTPGPQAGAVSMPVCGAPGLVLFLDPGDLALRVPPFPGGPRFLAKFCRELAREATKVADALEKRQAGESTGRHTLISDDDGQGSA